MRVASHPLLPKVTITILVQFEQTRLKILPMPVNANNTHTHNSNENVVEDKRPQKNPNDNVTDGEHRIPSACHVLVHIQPMIQSEQLEQSDQCVPYPTGNEKQEARFKHPNLIYLNN